MNISVLIILSMIAFITIILVIRFYLGEIPVKKRENFVKTTQYANNNLMYKTIASQTEALHQHYFLKAITYLSLSALCFFGSITLIIIKLSSDLSSMIIVWIIIFIVILVTSFILTDKYEKVKSEYDFQYTRANIPAMAIKAYNPTLTYSANYGFSKREYESCHFFEDSEYYSYSDSVKDDKTGFFCSDVRTYVSDDKGSITTFLGSIARMPIPNCNCEIIFTSPNKKKQSIYINGVQYILVSFESDIFNSLFSVYTTNEVDAYKVITPEVIEQLIHLKQHTYGDIEIRIIKNNLYVRFKSGDSFAPNLLNRTKEINNIISSIAVLDEVIRATNNIKNVIERKLR